MSSPAERRASHSVLFVCTANICRSPMAMVLFRALVQRLDPEGDWRIESAGTWAAEDVPASQGARMVMNRRGLDLAAHRSREVSRELLSRYDLILTMTQSHKEAILVEFPGLAGRVYQLGELAGLSGHNIADPYGGEVEEYEQTAEEIRELLEQAAPEIFRRAGAVPVRGPGES